MDNAQKAIMIGVGLFITIIIISIVLLITNLGTSMTDEATSNLGNMSASLQNQVKSQYDNKVLSGAEVKSLYNQYEGNDSFLLVFEIDQDNNSEHRNADLFYNDNGFVVPGGGALSISRGNDASEMFVHYGDAAGGEDASPARISTAAVNINIDILSSAQYNTYLIYDGSSVVGVYARLRNNPTAGGVVGVKGLSKTNTTL